MSAALAYIPPRDPLSKVGRRITQWRSAHSAELRFAAPMLSVCFDDFPRSAARTGAALLEAYGGRGAFYAAAGLAGKVGPCGRNFLPSDARRLAAAGHEVGCHTFTHGDCAQLPVAAALADIDANNQAIARMGCPSPARTLAYPYGETTLALKQALKQRFAAARGIAPGLNVGRVDLMQLRAYPLFGAGAVARLEAAIVQAAQRNAWLIAFTHDVSEAPSPWGARAAELEAVLKAARRAGMAILPVSAALARRLS